MSSSIIDSVKNNEKATSSKESSINIVQPLVVIIGAGLAGLSSAYKLIKFGHKNLLILEASNRLGGRVESYKFPDGARIDLGAQWLHGEHENPVFNWLKDDLNLFDCIEEEEVEFEGLFRANIDNELVLDELVHKCLDILLDIKHCLYDNSAILTANYSPLELYRKHFFNECSRNPSLKIINKTILMAILNWFELYETIDNSCEDLSKLSIKAYSGWTDFDNGKMVKLRGGWSSVVNKLVEFICEHRILTNCSVDKIEHSSEQVKIYYTNNNNRDYIICNHCIVTIPLGVMKNIDLEGFINPPLENEKLKLIKKLGFGSVNKIFLQFKEPFLQEEKGLKLLWLPDNNNTNDLPRWAKYITGFDLVTGHDNILLAWVGGLGAEEIEQYSEDEIGFICLKILNLFLPQSIRIPDLKSIKKSSWFCDRNFHGSYSYESVETVEANTQDLWEPICWPTNSYRNKQQQGEKNILIPRVQFAGEATALTMYATAHGAIISGWREAERLKKYI